MWKDFKKFAVKGNVIDLAVGVVIGGAFGAIITSLVNDVIMPLISIITGKVDFSKWVFTINEVEIKYGLFIGAIVNFLIIAFSIFIVIRQLSKFKKKEEPAPQPITTKECPFCKSTIHIDAVRCPSCTSSLE